MAAINPMDGEALRQHGAEILDVLATYWETLRSRKPRPDVAPGKIFGKFPPEPPQKPESWEDIIKDIEPLILDGNTHWQHPYFFAYYPTACSHPGVFGDILSTGIASVASTWETSPSAVEGEMIMMDWLAKALGLPEHFLFSHKGPGGGAIELSASDSTFVAVMGAKARALKTAQAINKTADLEKPKYSNGFIDSITQYLKSTMIRGLEELLVVYCSDQAHSSVERAALLANVNVRMLDTDDDNSLRGETVEKAIENDLKDGFIPFCVVATAGTTMNCAFDNIKELGELCKKYDIWMHVDAAYAGSSMICPEYRYLFDGLELADSFNFNPNKWMLVNFDCSPMWFKDRSQIKIGFEVNAKEREPEDDMPDFREMQVPMTRRHRALKIWFVMRCFGIEGIQTYIRNTVDIAKEFESCLLNDPQFELAAKVPLGVVTFRLKDQSNEVNERLMRTLNSDGRIHLVPGYVKGKYTLRLNISSSRTTMEDIRFAWKVVRECADNVLLKLNK